MADEALGHYADGRTFRLPATWQPLTELVRDVAVEQTQEALDGSGPVLSRLRNYYAPEGDYAGALVSELEPNRPDEISATDLLAVSMLSMQTRPRQARALLDPHSDRRRVVHQLLAVIPLGLPITSLDSDDAAVRDAVDSLYELHHALKTAGGGRNRWVFASKLCARKRPDLFPVRDNEVCSYLARGALSPRTGIGQFSNDLQVFAWLMSMPSVRARLTELRETLEGEGLSLDATDLRLLDVALWMAAVNS